MATIYVNKSGNDSNDGSSHAQAKLTVAGAVAASSSGDEIRIGSGEYVEGTITWPGGDLSFIGDGYVKLIAASAGHFIVVPHAHCNATFENLVFHLFNGVTVSSSSTATTHWSYVVTFIDCTIDTCIRMMHVTHATTNGSRTGRLFMTRCSIINCTHVVTTISGTHGHRSRLTESRFNHCIFIGLETAFSFQYSATTTSLLWQITEFRGNVVSDVDVFVEQHAHANGEENRTFPSAPVAYADNCFHDVGIMMILNSTEHLTLAALTEALSGDEKFAFDDLEADPQFVDPENHVFALRGTSPLHGLGQIAPYIGRYEKAQGFSGAYQHEGEWDIDSTPASDRGTRWIPDNGLFGKVGSSLKGLGGLVSPVFEADGLMGIERIDVTAAEIYPERVIDAEIGAAPNRRLVQVRGSLSEFAQNTPDGELPWQTVERGVTLSPRINAVFYQIRLVFRDDGVAA